MPHNLTSPRGGFPASSFKYTPLQHVRTMFVSFVQGLFSAAPLGAYHWAEADDVSEIYIADEAPIHTKTVGPRPAISFTRGPVQFYSLGLDDMSTYQFDTGRKEKSVLVPGTMSVNCSSRVDIESENIAWVVAEHLWLLRELLLKEGFFEIGRQPMIGAPTKGGDVVVGDGSDEWFTTTVLCPYQFSRTSSFTPLGQQILNSISISLRAASNAVRGLGAVTRPGADLPVGIIKSLPAAFDPNASDALGGTPNAGGIVSSLPLVPHPLNPAQLVTVRVVRGARAGSGIRPGGIPIQETTVEQSPEQLTATQLLKV